MINYAEEKSEMDFRTLALHIGSNIKSFRKKRGLSQSQASKKISCDKRFYQRIEAGKAGLTLRTLLKISVALEMPLSELLKVDQMEAAISVENAAQISEEK